MENNTSVGTVLEWILLHWETLALVLGLFVTIFKLSSKINKFTTTVNKTNETLNKEFPEMKSILESHEETLEDLEKSIGELKDHDKDERERNYLITKGVLASLRGLQEIGANGPTHEASSEIEDYLNKKAASN